MARPPKSWYDRGAWRTDFGGERNRVLIYGPENPEMRLQAEKELIRLREEARLVRGCPALETPFAVVVERFLESHAGRPVYSDYSNELHWFMGAAPSAEPDPGRAKSNRGKDR